MRERQIHPAIFVEVKRHDPHRGRQLFLVEIDGPKWSEFSFARIEIDGSSCLPARNDEVHGAIIIEVRGNNPRAGGRKIERRSRRHVCERAVPIVAPKNIVR